MAKLGEKTFEFKDVLKFFKVPLSCTEDKTYLNVGKNSIVKVYDQKPVHTWTLMHPHYFTSPVLYSDGNIYCVKDNNVLIRWKADEDNLKKAEKVKFQDCIFAVIPVQGELPLVLFDSGKYTMIDTNTFCDLKPFDFVFLKEHEKLIWADASVSSSHLNVFCLAYNEKDQNNSLYYFTVNKNDKSASNFHSQTMLHEKAILKSWCLNHHDSAFLSFWSDGTVFSHYGKDSNQTKVLSLKDIDVNSIVAIDSIDSTHIIVAVSGMKQQECILQIWDSKCAVLQARKVLKTPILDYIQIAAINSIVFLSFNNEVASVPFHVETPTFSAAVGKISECNKFVEYSWDYIEYSWDSNIECEPSGEESEAMDVCDQEIINYNQTSESVESYAQRLLNENSEQISESEVARLLQLAIRYKEKETDCENSCTKVIYELLNVVFSASFNDNCLVKYLKKLNSEEALIALELLLSYLNQTVKMSSNIRKPSNLQIINWACLIMQSQVEALFLKDKTSRKLLRQIEKALSAKREEYEDLQSIQNYSSVIEKKDTLPQECSDGKYCIENLDI